MYLWSFNLNQIHSRPKFTKTKILTLAFLSSINLTTLRCNKTKINHYNVSQIHGVRENREVPNLLSPRLPVSRMTWWEYYIILCVICVCVCIIFRSAENLATACASENIGDGSRRVQRYERCAGWLAFPGAPTLLGWPPPVAGARRTSHGLLIAGLKKLRKTHENGDSNFPKTVIKTR